MNNDELVQAARRYTLEHQDVGPLDTALAEFGRQVRDRVVAECEVPADQNIAALVKRLGLDGVCDAFLDGAFGPALGCRSCWKPRQLHDVLALYRWGQQQAEELHQTRLDYALDLGAEQEQRADLSKQVRQLTEERDHERHEKETVAEAGQAYARWYGRMKLRAISQLAAATTFRTAKRQECAADRALVQTQEPTTKGPHAE